MFIYNIIQGKYRISIFPPLNNRKSLSRGRREPNGGGSEVGREDNSKD